MALKGTLADLSVVELLQFPHAGRKTGRLVIQDGNAEPASLYYRAGNLIHAARGDVDPLEVVVDLVGWERGEFVFEPDVAPETATIQLSLHSLLMKALKLRDERRHDARREAVSKSSGRVDNDLGQALADALQEYAEVRYICIMDADGEALTEASRSFDASQIALYRQAAAACLREHPRTGLRRLICEDEDGVTVAFPYVKGGYMLVRAEAGESLGGVLVAVKRLAREIARSAGMNESVKNL